MRSLFAFLIIVFLPFLCFSQAPGLEIPFGKWASSGVKSIIGTGIDRLISIEGREPDLQITFLVTLHYSNFMESGSELAIFGPYKLDVSKGYLFVSNGQDSCGFTYQYENGVLVMPALVQQGDSYWAYKSAEKAAWLTSDLDSFIVRLMAVEAEVKANSGSVFDQREDLFFLYGENEVNDLGHPAYWDLLPQFNYALMEDGRSGLVLGADGQPVLAGSGAGLRGEMYERISEEAFLRVLELERISKKPKKAVQWHFLPANWGAK
ncbi:MAG TPA: hypothetical protein ENJ82_18325 [Bacteroidetes bacterium]|nr:hypothetical protein [Bacteroidota bacterium]